MDPSEVTRFPVLVKASAGGGGRGMRVVRDAGELAEAVTSARREAAAAFGDGTVFCEPYLDRARHVEVQILADTYGTVHALGERECSIQRRHQKLVEEAPSPGIAAGLRTALCEAAVAAASAVGYVNAGTVEFLVAPDGTFCFLEMNTRLQVEHPVTECVTGLDLVRLQLLVASGAPVPQPPTVTGHAIEVRLVAEDPTAGWLPATGVLHRFEIPDTVRVDAGVVTGSEVGVHYDPLLAKVIAWAPTRREAARTLADALVRSRIHGVVTNRDLLVRVLRDEDFLAGDTDTGYLDRHPDVFAPLVSTVDTHALAAALAGAASRAGRFPSGWRNVGRSTPTVEYADGASVAYRFAEHEASPSHAVLDVDGVRQRFDVHRVGNVSYVDGPDGSVTLTELPRFPLPHNEIGAGSLTAPLPGAVGRVVVSAGQRVGAGDLLLTLEAMKLEHPVLAPHTGTVAELLVKPGEQVERGTVLAVIAPEG